MSDRRLLSMMLVAALLLAGVLFFFWDSLAPQAGSGGSTAQATQEPKRAVPARAKAGAKGPAHPGSKKGSLLAENEEKQVLISVYELESPIPPFPNAAVVRAGISKAEVKQKFGAPDFSATWTDVGGLKEKYIYLGPTQSTTFVLYNGSVVSVRTEPFDRR